MTETNETKAEDTKALATKQNKAQLDQTMTIVNAAEINGVDMSGSEVIASGGVTKWVNLKAFMDNPNASDKEPVKGNGNAFAGALLSREEIPVKDTDSGELKADGTKVRFYYTLRLVSPCPVSYKDENKDDVEEIALPGEVVAIGERHHLRPLRALCEDGGYYIMVIKPHSRVKISKTQTMWTFDLVKKTVRPPMKMQVLAPGQKVPF